MKKGYIYSIISAILFGSAGLIVKLAFIEGIEPIGLLTLQYIIAVIIMFILLYIKNKKMFLVSGQDLFRLFILGSIGNTFMTVFYYTAYSYLSMAMVTILLYTYPIIVFIYSLMFKSEVINIQKAVALIFAFIGCVLALGLTEGYLKYSIKGIIFGLLAAVFYAFMNIYSEKKLYKVDALTINAYSTLFSLLALIVYKFPSFIFKGNISIDLLSYTAVLAVFCEIIPLTLMYSAIKYIGSLKASIIGNIETPTAMLLSYVFLKEHLSLLQLIGAAIVIYAVYIIRK